MEEVAEGGRNRGEGATIHELVEVSEETDSFSPMVNNFDKLS